MRNAMLTPWGRADHVADIGNGILRVDTPSHGGYFVPAQLNRLIPTSWRKATWNLQGLAGWYEEDCDWALVAMTFPERFPAHAIDAARATFVHCFAAKV